MLPVPIRRPYEIESLPQTRMSALLSILLRLGDMVVLAAAAVLAYRLRFGSLSMPIEFERAIARGLLFTMIVLGSSSCYSGWRAKHWTRHGFRLLALWVMVFVLGVLYVALLKVPGVTSRLWWAYWCFGTVVASVALRVVCRAVNRYAVSHGHDVCRAVVVGDAAAASRVAQQLRSCGAHLVELRGWFSVMPDAREAIAGVAHLGAMDTMRAYVASNGIRQVWIAPGDASAPWLTSVLGSLEHSTADIKYVPNVCEREIFNGSVELLNELPVINLRASPLNGEARVIKGVEDRVLALLILLVVGPLMALIASGVKLSSPGPVLFKQKRHGLDGKTIEVWKFRSMRLHAESHGEVTQATREDPRVTRFGRLLRRTSLDELPQFFNVLEGTMSIVGPRPHAIEHNNYYKSVVQNYMQRHRMKPGITGWAQVNGLRGETDTLEKMSRRVDYDLYYIQNWSVLFDLRIIVMTLAKGFVGAGAY
ncbi:undecaprenyl-phosphate glucose phosphotransferase [Lysobacter auxotrophicus]|uniref:Undecaprenyl-phosphate glucose phosphotransferase n=2 Tax=Lysobacter auxotrophicus TaxID=2992573 RepID=A0ABM8DEE5_9GAMM|nr:undecaprenyl-phosphate glucose phosphotransferase [Lysobacter auxotrophicus]